MLDEGFLFPREERIRLNQRGYSQICGLVDERDGGCCVLCGTPHNIQHHHVRFRSAWGSDTIDNLVCVCLQCHGAHCHGVNAKETRAALLAYLEGDKCKEFEEAHRGKINSIYRKRRSKKK